jgi:hypothetical protein
MLSGYINLPNQRVLLITMNEPRVKTTSYLKIFSIKNLKNSIIERELDEDYSFICFV